NNLVLVIGTALAEFSREVRYLALSKLSTNRFRKTMSTVVKREARIHEFPKPVEVAITPSKSQRFFNRELSLLAFHARVLEEALDPGNPLLEKLKFVSIFSANLDEFFMIRVSGLKEEIEQGITEVSEECTSPAEQLCQIREQVVKLINEQARVLREE